MAVDLENRPSTPDADQNDPGQRHFDDVFNELTSKEHQAKNGQSGGSSGQANSNGMTPKETAKAEGSAAAVNNSSAGGSNGDGKSLFNGAAEQVNPLLRFFSRGNKKGITGGLIGFLVTGSIFFGFGVSTGPLQFIHLAELLKDFHLNEQSDEQDERLSKLTRLYRYGASGGEIKETRLGIFANGYAHTLDAKLEASGITSRFDKAGFFQGYEIDRNNENFKGLSDQQIKESFEDKYGISLISSTDADGKLLINAQSSKLSFKNYMNIRRLNSSVLEEAGLKGVSGKVATRIVGKRQAITWHVITDLDSRAKLKALNIAKSTRDKFKSDTKDGVTDESPTNNTPAEDDKTPAPKPGETSGEAEGGVAEKGVEDVKGGGSIGKIAGGGAALLGVACVAYGIANNSAQIKQDQEVLPIVRTGMEFVSLGSQAQFGAQGNPNFAAQLGSMSSYINSDKGSWTDAASVQAELGQKQDGVQPDGTLKNLGQANVLSFLTSGALGTSLSAACSDVGQFALTAFSFVTGPVSTVVGYAFGEVVQAEGWLQDLAGWLAGDPFDIDKLSPPEVGNYLNFGVKLAADQKAVAAGGRELTPGESSQLAALQNGEQTSDFEHQSFAYRVFSPDTPRSLVGSLIDAQNTSILGNITQSANGLLHFGSSLMSVTSGLFNHTAYAATTPYKYGDLNNYGFSEAELADPSVQDPYANASAVIDPNQGILQTMNGSTAAPNTTAIAAAQSCFGVTISPDGTSVQAAGTSQTNTYDPNYSNSECASGAKAGLSTEKWLQLRMFIFDSETADSMSCYGGDDSACADIGFDGNGASPGDDAAGATGSPVTASGTAAQIATQLLALWGKGLTGTDYAKSDLTATSQGKTINNSSTCNNTISINANLLQVILTATSKYNLYLDNIASGHGCDQFLHPKGRASDIGGATDIATGKKTNFCSNGDQGCDTSGDDQTVDHQFYVYMASILPKGGEMGQDECAGRTNIKAPPDITFFNDTCSHQHIDLGDQ